MFSFFLRFCYFFIIFIRIFSSTLFVVRGYRTSFCLPVCLSVPRGMPKSGALSFVFLSIVVDGSIFFHFPPHLFCCNSFPLFPHILGHPSFPFMLCMTLSYGVNIDDRWRCFGDTFCATIWWTGKTLVASVKGAGGRTDVRRWRIAWNVCLEWKSK